MELKLFTEENKQQEKEHLAGFELDAALFGSMGLRIVQIVPDRSSYRLETDKGFFSLKKLEVSRPEMDFVLQCLKYLEARGFKNIFGIVGQPDGGSYTEYCGGKYYLTQWKDGRDCDFTNPADIRKAAGLLAEFHNAAGGFRAAKTGTLRNYLGKWPEYFSMRTGELEDIRQAVAGKPDKGVLDKAYLEYAGGCMEAAETALQLLMESHYAGAVRRAGREGGFVHRDLLHNSLLHTFEGEIYFIDFEYFAVDLPLHDLGCFLLRGLKRNGWSADNARIALESYSGVMTVRPEELDILPPYFLFPLDFRQISGQYFAQPDGAEAQELIDKISLRSEENEKKKRFIAEFRYLL